LKGFISWFTEGEVGVDEEDEVETELLLMSEGVFPLCGLLNEEVPKISWLALNVWVFWDGLLVLEGEFVFTLVLLDVEGGFPPLNSSCEICGVRVRDFVEPNEGTCGVLVWEGPDFTIIGIFWVFEVVATNWLFWKDEEAAWYVGFSEEIKEDAATFPLLAAAAALEGNDVEVGALWLENWGDCEP